jgi:hypothetical protein
MQRSWSSPIKKLKQSQMQFSQSVFDDTDAKSTLFEFSTERNPDYPLYQFKNWKESALGKDL